MARLRRLAIAVRGAVRADLRAVFVEDAVADIVDAVVDGSVPADQLPQPRRGRRRRRQAGDRVADLGVLGGAGQARHGALQSSRTACCR